MSEAGLYRPLEPEALLDPKPRQVIEASTATHVSTRKVPGSIDQEWPLKSILWPPFSNDPTEVKILTQEANGPCSFLALCNVLLVSRTTLQDRNPTLYNFLAARRYASTALCRIR